MNSKNRGVKMSKKWWGCDEMNSRNLDEVFG
jgi:hypothetical protein